MKTNNVNEEMERGGVKVYKLKDRVFQSQFRCEQSQYPEFEAMYSDEELDSIVEIEIEDTSYTNVNPVLWSLDATVKVDLERIDIGEDELDRLVKEFFDWLREEKADGVEMFTKAIEICEKIKEQYSTRGTDATVYDTGGDFPNIYVFIKWLA